MEDKQPENLLSKQKRSEERKPLYDALKIRKSIAEDSTTTNDNKCNTILLIRKTNME